MPKTTQLVLFTVDELSDTAKNVAVQALQESAHNTDHEWWEQPIEHYKEALGMVGITSSAVSLDLTDDGGVNFVGAYDSSDADYVKLAEEYPAVYGLVTTIDSPIAELETTVTARIYYKNGVFGGKENVAVDDVDLLGNPDYDLKALEYERDNFDYASWENTEHALAAEQLIAGKIRNAEHAKELVGDYITAVKDTMCDHVLGELKSEYENLCTDEAVIETMRCEQMLFLADGTRAPDFLTDNAVDVLEFEDVIADGSIEGAGYQCAEDDSLVYTINTGEFVGNGEPNYEVDITRLDDGEFITNRIFTTETDAKLWAAKYSLGERS